ncbi:Hypothetical protein CINCED_3A002340 [Cinara cedri]|uniref:Seryl-tRNA synthetase n=1 Tax=Cinara cedri TaxID=506608 RepID=A0A5E4M1S2_9HEMI|nr:Hypothetical protein CINCED_3A002340 [Cinara cedri]
MIKKLSSSLHSLLKITKKYSTSKLYIPYNETSYNYVVVEPYIDLENRLKNIQTLKDNITLRGLSIDLDKIFNNWSEFINVKEKLINLNTEKQNIALQLKRSKMDNDEIIRLKECQSKVITQLRLIRDQITTLEKEVVIPSLGIPNTLHPDCPLSESKILFHYDSKNKYNNKHGIGHVEIGTALDCIDYTNSVIVYLKNEASIFEQAIMSYASETLEQLNFVPFCNSDIIKSVIVEGCGGDINNADQTFILSGKKLHLTGGASLQSFCAFLTKQSVGGIKLPLKLFTTGRSYKPSNNNNGLFSAVQTNAVEFIVGSMDEYKAKEQFDEMLAIYKHLYTDIGLDYRIVYSPVYALENWESLRAYVELYSVSLRDYIPVASLSLTGDFISKRLRMYWSNKEKHNFLHLINGKIVDTNVLLGCLLEQNIKEFTVPKCLKNYMIL